MQGSMFGLWLTGCNLTGVWQKEKKKQSLGNVERRPQRTELNANSLSGFATSILLLHLGYKKILEMAEKVQESFVLSNG